MRVRLKGVASATKRLASGEKVKYYYAWRGGPQLLGKPGSPEFVQAYEQAHRERKQSNPALFRSIIAGYLASPEFADVRDRTKSDYQKQLVKIERAFGDLPIVALDDPCVTKEFLEWRDGFASSPRQADYAWTCLCCCSHGREAGGSLHTVRLDASSVCITATAQTKFGRSTTSPLSCR
jgi:hypothetical protein